MSRNDYKWFLVQWNDGGFDVVHVRCLVNALHDQLNAGAAVMAIVKGERKAGILVSKSYDRHILDQILGKVNNVETEQDRDFSPSGSSWEPSDEDCGSDSDDGNEKENIKKVRFNLSNISKKICINETPKRRILTPSHRANAIIPESMKKEKMSNSNNSSRKRTFAEACNSNNKSKSPQNPTRNIKKREVTLNNVTIDIEQIEAMSKCFEYVLKKIRDMRSPFAQVDRIRDWHKYEIPIVHDEIGIPEHDNENDRSGSVESNRSDDNVLITNKFSIVNTSASEEKYELAKVPKNERVSIDNAETKVYSYNNKKYNQNDVNSSSTSKNFTKHNPVIASEDEWVPIGSGKTLIHKDKFRQVKWKSYTIATRTLLLASFPRRILATHSLTGKKSPAFQNKPAKMCLDPKIISDIIMEVKDRFNVKENLIRTIITTKCADECKMYKVRRNKKKSESTKTKQEPTANKETTENVILEDNIKTSAS